VARGDVVCDAHRFVGEDLVRGDGAAADLGQQRRRRAAVAAVVAVLGRQVRADKGVEP
jgi:hypothetical protein